MPRFYLIDHSLKKIGGHHYEYALHVLQAAERAGYAPVLGAHRKFAGVREVPASWQVVTPYRASTYSSAAIMGGLRRCLPVAKPDKARSPDQLWIRLMEWGRQARGIRRRRAFTAGTLRLFDAIPTRPGDQVLLATINELDLLGAMDYWRSEPRSREIDWHLQFHFNIEPDWDCDLAMRAYYLDQLRDIFTRSQAEFPGHRLHYYNTTAQLAEQYNRLKTVSFRELSYPTNPGFQQSKVSPTAGQPLRLTCVGGVRQEKGIGILPQLVADLHGDYLTTGRAQLAIQAESAKKLPHELRTRLGDGTTTQRPIVLVQHPLSTDAYRRLIIETDIGLLLYDRRQYQARCSGVLVEMLAAGVPVIVPAGCWLADQISPAVYRYQATLPQTMTTVGDELKPWRGTFLDRAQRIFAIPSGASHVWLSLRWQIAKEHRSYLSVTVRSIGSGGAELARRTEILSNLGSDRSATCCVHLPDGTARVDIRLADAYGHAAVELFETRLRFLLPPQTDSVPSLSAVGQIVSDPSHLAAAARDMIEHHPHYLQTAADFATRWSDWHNPDRVVLELIQRQARVAAA